MLKKIAIKNNSNAINLLKPIRLRQLGQRVIPVEVDWGQGGTIRRLADERP